MEIKINLEKQGHNSKPSAKAGIISDQVRQASAQTEITPQELADKIKHGYTFTPGVIGGNIDEWKPRNAEGKRKALQNPATGADFQTSDFWQQAQIIAVDIDNEHKENGKEVKNRIELTPAAALETCKAAGIDPYLIYKTFSYTPEHEKFRVLIILDKPITDFKKDYDLIGRFAYLFDAAIAKKYKEAGADPEPCADPSIEPVKLIFGGAKDCIVYQTESTTPINKIEALPQRPTEAPRNASKAKRQNNPPKYAGTAEAQSERELLTAALFAIDPAGLDYSEWLKVAAAAKYAGLDYATFDRWNAQDTGTNAKGQSRYNEQANYNTWQSLADAGQSRGEKYTATAGTIFYFAKNRGWTFPSKSYDAKMQKVIEQAAELSSPQEISPADFPADFFTDAQEAPAPGMDPTATDETNKKTGGKHMSNKSNPGAKEKPDSIAALLSKDYARYIGGGMLEEEKNKYVEFAQEYARQLKVRINNPQAYKPYYLLQTGLEFSQPTARLEWCLECLLVDKMQAAPELRQRIEDPDAGEVILLCRPDSEAARILEKLLTDANIKCSHMNPERLSAADYLTGGFYNNDIEFIQQYAGRKMGLNDDIDRYLTLYPGLAVLGGQASLGKTTFCINVANKLLERGEHVLYFSLEQRPEEIMTKVLARHIFENNPQTKITNLMLNAGDRSAETCAAIDAQAEKLKNFHIIECSFETTAQWIIDQVTRYTDNNPNITPVVIVDYLQIIAAPPYFRGDKRATVDFNLKALKKMQKTRGLFVIVISSFNRSSNLEPVSYEAFLETSCIEYTCDYVFGLQLTIQDTDNEQFYITEGAKGGKKAREDYDKKRMMQEAQTQSPKKVQFVSLKNRKGRQFFKANFDYYPAHDYFCADPTGSAASHPYSDTMKTAINAAKKNWSQGQSTPAKLTQKDMENLNKIFEACEHDGRATLDDMTAYQGGGSMTRQALERQFNLHPDYFLYGGAVSKTPFEI